MLIVDDDEDLRGTLVDCLCAAGIAAFDACDGVDALEKIRAGLPPCALVLDMDMPRLDGSALLAEMRTDRALSAVPVITMTAGVEPVGLETQGHLSKPFDLGRMFTLLFQACRSCGVCDGERPVFGSLFEARRAAGSPASVR